MRAWDMRCTDDPDGASKMDAILQRLGAVPGGSGTRGLASLGAADPGAGSGAAPVLSAGLGRASSIGALSVPPSWTAATPTVRRVCDSVAEHPPRCRPDGPSDEPGKPAQRNAFGEYRPYRGIRGAPPQGRPTITITVTPRPPDSDNGG